MQPFYFGDSSQPLFGIYNPPAGVHLRDEGIVCCYPVAHEYMRAHRAFRQLAEALAGSGFHVLRFDYSATGDSALPSEAATVDGWKRDIRLACREMQDMAGVERLCLVGLRFGAILAAMAALEEDSVRRLVLWDPVVSGRDYVAGMEAMQALKQLRFDAVGNPLFRRLAKSQPEKDGLQIGSELRENIAAADLAALLGNVTARTLLAVSSKDPSFAALRDDRAVHLDYRHFPDAGDWRDVRKSGGVLFAAHITRGIVDALGAKP